MSTTRLDPIRVAQILCIRWIRCCLTLQASPRRAADFCRISPLQFRMFLHYSLRCWLQTVSDESSRHQGTSLLQNTDGNEYAWCWLPSKGCGIAEPCWFIDLLTFDVVKFQMNLNTSGWPHRDILNKPITAWFPFTSDVNQQVVSMSHTHAYILLIRQHYKLPHISAHHCCFFHIITTLYPSMSS